MSEKERTSLINRMFLILHDPFSGKPVIRHQHLTSALAAAELADLVLSQNIGLEDDAVVLAHTDGTAQSGVDSFVLETIQRTGQALTIRNWIDALGEPLYELVARQLVDDGTVRRQRGGRRLLGRAADRFPSAELLRAAGPRLQLERMLRHSEEEIDLETTILAAVLGALRVEHTIDVDGDRAAVKAAVAAAADSLPIDLRSLLVGVEASGAAAATADLGSAIAPMRRSGPPS
ncbi:MAG TPA: GPP34 family phosphoprotein [Pseudonocardia sp.]|nr:GPP34 family phosphoprotein [Pseudonocardia sp.]